MVKDAEAHADEDRKFHELVDARNQGEGMIHATTKSLKDLGDKVEADEKSAIEAAIKELQDVLKGDDKDAIEAKTAALAEQSGKLAQRVYQQKQEAEGGAQAQPDTGRAAAGRWQSRER